MPVVLESRLISVGFESLLSVVPGMAEQLETFLAEPEQVVFGQCEHSGLPPKWAQGLNCRPSFAIKAQHNRP